MPTGPQPIQLMMAPFPEGFSGDLDEQWQQAAQLLQGTVIVSGTSTPTKLYFSFPTSWPTGWVSDDINQTWSKGTSLLSAATISQVIPLSISHFPDGFQGNLNETWQQGITQMTGMVP
jgi:hypothetical protein